jgi:hypothetical protein
LALFVSHSRKELTRASTLVRSQLIKGERQESPFHFNIAWHESHSNCNDVYLTSAAPHNLRVLLSRCQISWIPHNGVSIRIFVGAEFKKSILLLTPFPLCDDFVHLCNEQCDHKNAKAVLNLAFANLSDSLSPGSFSTFHFLFEFPWFSQNVARTVIHKLKLFHFHVHSSLGLGWLLQAKFDLKGGLKKGWILLTVRSCVLLCHFWMRFFLCGGASLKSYDSLHFTSQKVGHLTSPLRTLSPHLLKTGHFTSLIGKSVMLELSRFAMVIPAFSNSETENERTSFQTRWTSVDRGEWSRASAPDLIWKSCSLGLYFTDWMATREKGDSVLLKPIKWQGASHHRQSPEKGRMRQFEQTGWLGVGLSSPGCEGKILEWNSNMKSK